MNDNVRKEFQAFSAAMAAAPYDLVDILDVITGFANMGMPVVGLALASHMKDFLLEQQRTAEGSGSILYSAIVAESYRRAFCDVDTAAMYGTQDLASNPAMVASLLRQVTEGVSMLNQSDNPEQMTLALSADTTHAH